MVFHEITRDAIQRALERHARHRRAPRRRAGDAPDPRPPLRLRGLAGPLEEGHAAASPPVACSRSRRGSSSSASASASRSSPPRTGTSLAIVRPRLVRRPGSSRSTGKRVAQGRDFGSDGQAARATIVVLDEDAARGLAERLGGATFERPHADEKPYTRRPAAPFRTSTLQQEASRKLRFTRADDDARRAAPLRERLHHLHAHRLDVALRSGADGGARARRPSSTAPTTCPRSRGRTQREVKNAQEAHEAIRPAGDRFRTPDEVRGELDRDELALYELIWKRTIASQMEDARGQTVSLRIGRDVVARRGRRVRRVRHGDHVPRLPRRVRGRARDEPTDDEEERRLPTLEDGQELEPTRARGAGARDDPAAALHRGDARAALEERGIGRPSTYASIIGTILDRGYVFKKRHRARPDVPRVRGRRSCSSSTSAGSSTTTSPRGWRTTSTGSPAGDEEPRRVAPPLLLRRRRATPGLHELVTALGEIDARAVNSIPIGERHRAPRRPLRPVPRARRGARERARRTSRRTSSRSRRPRSCSRSPGRPRARRASRDGPADRRARPAASART